MLGGQVTVGSLGRAMLAPGAGACGGWRAWHRQWDQQLHWALWAGSSCTGLCQRRAAREPPTEPGFTTPAFIQPPPALLPTKPQPVPCQCQAHPMPAGPAPVSQPRQQQSRLTAPPGNPPAAGTTSPLLAAGILLQAFFPAGIGEGALVPFPSLTEVLAVPGGDALCGPCSRHCPLPAA